MLDQLESRLSPVPSTLTDHMALFQLLCQHAQPSVINLTGAEGKRLVEVAAHENCLALSHLLSLPSVDLPLPGLISIFCQDFARHLQANSDLAFSCFTSLAHRYEQERGRPALLVLLCFHEALKSFSLSHFWTFSVAPKVIRFFVDLGFDLNQPDEDGRTVLHWSYATGKPKLVELCKDLGALEEVRDKEGKRPADVVRSVRKWKSVDTSGTFK